MKKSLSISLAILMFGRCSTYNNKWNKEPAIISTSTVEPSKKLIAKKKIKLERDQYKNEITPIYDKQNGAEWNNIIKFRYPDLLETLKTFKIVDDEIQKKFDWKKIRESSRGNSRKINIHEIDYKYSKEMIQTASENSSILLFIDDSMRRAERMFDERYSHEYEKPKNSNIIWLNPNRELEEENLLSIAFNVGEASFYAGYLSAKYLSENHSNFNTKESPGLKITATASGIKEKENIKYVGGFEKGVEYWNSNIANDDQNKMKVEFVKFGPDIDSHNLKTYRYNFKYANDLALKLEENKIDIFLGSHNEELNDIFNALNEIESNILFVGTKSDLVEKYPPHSWRFLTSICKDYSGVIKKAVATIYGDIEFDEMNLGSRFIANIDNGFVSLGKSSKNKISYDEFIKLRKDLKFVTDAKNATKKISFKYKI